jgi:hypothetical protein
VVISSGRRRVRPGHLCIVIRPGGARILSAWLTDVGGFVRSGRRPWQRPEPEIKSKFS